MRWSSRTRSVLVWVSFLVLIATACTGAVSEEQDTPPTATPTAATPSVAVVCDNQQPGPAELPAGAVRVDPGVAGALQASTESNPAGTTFWLAPGTHTFGDGEFDQVSPRAGNVYLGAPGAVVDGRGLNNFAFTGSAENVTIRHLTVRGFTAPVDQGVVNHDSGNGWIIEYNTIEQNRGAGMMAGARQQIRFNCLRDNGQYAINAYQAGDGITDLVVEGNEIVGNNTDDWESRIEGCGCTGGVKFWAVDGADIRNNWVHDNRGVGLWADTNNNDFLVEGNLIENNDGEALFYETSYNMVMRDNVVRGNTLVTGREFESRSDDFPVGTVYLSEAGGEPRVPARTDRIEIYDNLFEGNWSGITAWENADRFCNSAANTSTGNCTLLVPDLERCAPPGIADEPLYDDCRWKTQRVLVHSNTFVAHEEAVGCTAGFSSRMSILSNFGTFPDWSPYQGAVIQQAIVRDQDIVWRDNVYRGDWTFVLGETGRPWTTAEWQGDPYRQDAASTFEPVAPSSACGSQDAPEPETDG